MLTKTGLELIAPSPGDIVTVVVRGNTNPHHYRESVIAEVLASNASHAFVEFRAGYEVGRREQWAIRQHRWFEASELLIAADTKGG